MLPGRRYSADEVIYLAKRFKWLIALTWVIIAFSTWIVGEALPDRFRSETVLQVVGERIQPGLVRSTVTDTLDRRLPAMTQQILSRTRLERIIQDFNLYQQERKSKLMEDIVVRMRDDISVQTVKGDTIQVSFVAGDARTAMKVAEQLGSLFVEENVRDRTILAEGTNQFLDSQLEEARRRLLDHERRLEEYRRLHAGELPSQLPANLQAMQNLQSQNAQLDESVNRDRDRQLVLERMLADVNAETVSAAEARSVSGGDATHAGAQSASAQLEAARTQLQGMLLRLKPEHPDILRAQRVIGELERKADDEAARAPVSDQSGPRPQSPSEALRANRVRDIKAELEMLDRQIQHKADQKKQVAQQLAEYQRRSEAVPTRESELIALTRDYETLQKIYTTLLAKGEDAKVAYNLERRQMGEQFRIIDQARLPERPFSPNRLFINLAGILGGLLVGLGLVALIEVRDTSMRSDDDVVATLSLPVLATIPAIVTAAEARVQRRRQMLLAAVSGMVVVAAGAAVLAWREGYLARWL